MTTATPAREDAADFPPDKGAAMEMAEEDLMPLLRQACGDMDVGQLIHGENFSLFEAMSALEIMDPKMDAGMATGGYKTVEEAMTHGEAQIELTIPQLLDVMDYVLACEATWHNGHSLAQTVFTCLYLHKPERTVSNPLLHAYCRAVRATCVLLRNWVCRAGIPEEEDFATHTFGLPLDVEGDGRCMSGINVVEEQLSRQLKAIKGGALLKKKGPDEVLVPTQENPELEAYYCSALLSRLRFRKTLYSILLHMEKPQGRGLDAAQKLIRSISDDLACLREYSPSLKRQAPAPTSNGDDGGARNGQSSPVDMEDKGPSGENERSPTGSGRPAIGFNDNINRRLLAPTPPRPISILSWEETLSHFEKLVRDLGCICQLPSMSRSLRELMQFCVDFGKVRPGPIARSLLQMLVLKEDRVLGQEHMGDLLFRDMHLPHDLLRGDCQMAVFTRHTANVIAALLRILCANPSRQRRRLGKFLPDWDILIQEAETAGESKVLMRHMLMTFPNAGNTWWRDNVLASWTVEQTCWVIVHYLMLGFELELYSPSELSMVYWYLENVLVIAINQQLTKERHLYEHSVLSSEQDSASGKKKGNRRKGGSKGKEFHPSNQVLLLECLNGLCQGLVRMIAAFTRDDKFRPIEPPFNSEAQWFEQRFEPLHRVRLPEPLHYADYLKYTDHSNLTVKHLYQLAHECFLSAKLRLREVETGIAKDPHLASYLKAQRVAEVRNMEQVATANLWALKIALLSGPGSDLQASFNFSKHPCFAVAVLKKNVG
ncbi:hypothetical protein CBR_g29413 [Chara braunii]|uniref:N-alpha-acetyltransferase 35, NatC auxiliary subunit n=1 Tax=Chara braunii TaxID=69332 RepID=A0A388LAB4_CHABU|nr:hypothetical protein CBR_g29413 [Chara braunii]|eukprot:GBG79261.1 hypothetical protein CBR_g29413 [Chara braunii]